MRKIIVITLFILLAGCATVRPAGTAWEDAALVSEQRAAIEQQRQIITDLGEIIKTGADNLRNAEIQLGNLTDGTVELDEWLRGVDAFVRAVIAEQRRLEEVQRTDWGTDAGER
jgi:hypothetical protein